MDTIMGSVIALVGVILGIVCATIADYFKGKQEDKRIESTLELSRKSLSIQYITDKRTEWIYEVRNVASEYISLVQECAESLINHEEKSIVLGHMPQINMCLAKLRLLFNFSGEEDKIILSLLDDIIANLSLLDKFKSKEHEKALASLTKHIQVYLKLEWERIKIETDYENTMNDLDDNLNVLKKKYYSEYIDE